MQAQAKVWDQAAVHELLDQNAAAVAKAVLTIYARQTAGEKVSGETVEANGRGFSGSDAEFLSSIAVKLPRYGMRLTEKQLAAVRPKMKRYWRQLLDEIESRGGQVDYRVKKARKPETTKAPCPAALPVDDVAYSAEVQARHRRPDPALAGAF